jgi:hypothetical protein
MASNSEIQPMGGDLDTKINQLDEKKKLLQEEKKRLKDETAKLKLLENKLQEQRQLILTNIHLRKEFETCQQEILLYEARNKELEDLCARGEIQSLTADEAFFGFVSWPQDNQLQEDSSEFYQDDSTYRKFEH